MKAISRRHFLQGVGAAMVAIATMTLPAIAGGDKPKSWRCPVRVRPLSSSKNLSRSELAFYRKARFSCAADAMRALASRGMTGEIYAE